MLRKFSSVLLLARNSLLGSAMNSSKGAGKEFPKAAASSGKQETLSSQKEGTQTAFARNSVTKEQILAQTLKQSLPGITYVSIQDISGGCGDMFEVNVEAKEFSGLSRVKQHRLVTDSLKNEIAKMHGIRINTKSPPPEPPTPTK